MKSPDRDAAELLERLKELNEAYGDGLLTDNAAAHLGDEIWDRLPSIIEGLSELATLRRRVAEMGTRTADVQSARNIAVALSQSVEALERHWPAYKRGSNAQRALDEIKQKRVALESCLDDALAPLPPGRNEG